MLPLPKRVLLLVNGSNLNRLGTRDPMFYGSDRLQDITLRVQTQLHAQGIDLLPFQSNHEGAIIDFLQQEGPSCCGIIINPGALGHYSYALRDCLADLEKPCVEVHISNVHQRESFRHQLVLSAVVSGQVIGLGAAGYELAADWFLRRFRQEDATS